MRCSGMRVLHSKMGLSARLLLCLGLWMSRLLRLSRHLLLVIQCRRWVQERRRPLLLLWV